jgi:hypothetical protein
MKTRMVSAPISRMETMAPNTDMTKDYDHTHDVEG